MLNLLLSSRNAHKAREIEAMLEGVCQLSTLADYPDAPPVIEDQPHFAGNAIKKAVQLAVWLRQRPASGDQGDPHPSRVDGVIADDSGLEVDALQGAPGVLSARFANPHSPGNSSDTANNARLLELLRDVPADGRTARFRCVMALCPVGAWAPSTADPGLSARAEVFEGICEGAIISSPRGTAGFGYDPLFVPNGYSQTYAELGDSIKNTISHRARALQKLLQWLKDHRTGNA